MYVDKNIGKTCNCAFCDKQFTINEYTSGQIRTIEGIKFTCSDKCFVKYVNRSNKNKQIEKDKQEKEKFKKENTIKVEQKKENNKNTPTEEPIKRKRGRPKKSENIISNDTKNNKPVDLW